MNNSGLFSSVVNPDPYSATSWIRIRIRNIQRLKKTTKSYILHLIKLIVKQLEGTSIFL